jgi:hypothetical protein
MQMITRTNARSQARDNAPNQQVWPDLAAEFERLSPWITRFYINDVFYGGDYDAAGDHRLAKFFEFAGSPCSVLELGSFEGGHSVALAAHPSITRVVSIEGRKQNIEKARFIQRITGDHKVEFIHADLEQDDLKRLGRFDAVLCLGVLYHLASPWKLINKIAAVSDRVFIWTHFALDKESELLTSDVSGSYRVESGVGDLSGGLGTLSCRLTLGSLMACLDGSGLRLVEACEIDMTHPSGPGVLFGARRA